MGQEKQCTALWNGLPGSGKALLETDYVLFRGTYRIRIPFSEIRHSSAAGGRLILQTQEGELELEIGPVAERWQDRIEHPKTVLDKVGIARGDSVALVGPFDSEFLAGLGALLDVPPLIGRPDRSVQTIFCAMEAVETLESVAGLSKFLNPGGAIWLVYRKGKSGTVKELDVISAGRAAGLVDIKVVAFSESHTALKFVVPRSARASPS